MSEHSDRSPQRKPREDFVKEKQKKLLSSINYQQQVDTANNGSTPILMNSYQTISKLAQRFHLKLNVIPSLFGSFEPKPLYLRTDPISERAVADLLPLDQVRSYIDMIHQYNVKRSLTANQYKSKNQNSLMVPLIVTKTQNDPNENVCQLDFFANSAYERFNRTFGKSFMLFQRYIPCKGSNANVIRCIYHRDRPQKLVYRIQSNVKMTGHVDVLDEEGKGEYGSPAKKQPAAQTESFMMTQEKVRGYAHDIIKQIKERLDQLDDPNATPLEFGVDQVLLSPTVQATFDMYGQATGGNSNKSNELYMAQVSLQEEIDKNCKTIFQYCTQDSKPEEMTIVEAKITNYPSINEQMNSLVQCLDQYLRLDKHLTLKELAVDFVTDFMDDRHYFLQIKFLDGEEFAKPVALKPLFHQRKVQSSNPRMHFD